MSVPRRQSQEQEKIGPPSLIDISLEAVIGYRRFLGNLGPLPDHQYRRILALLNRPELESVEDLTLKGSGVDLRWHTWHLWYLIYKAKYGDPEPEELLELPGKPPVDYEPPKIDIQQADYRTMIRAREEADAERKAAAISRLRAGYTAENRKRLHHGVEYTTKLPPPKRGKASSPGAVLQKQLAAYNASKTLAGKPAVKVMKDLGLGKSSGGNGSRGSFKPVPTGRSTLAKQTSQPSALACLAKKPQQSGTAAVGMQLSSSSQLGRAGQQQQQKQQCRLSPQQQQQQGIGCHRDAQGRHPAAAAAGHRPSSSSGGGGAGHVQRGKTGSSLSLLDTPVQLPRNAAAARR